MCSHGLEQRWAIYDSHKGEDFFQKHPADLTYFRGDVVKVLERTNEHWGLGLCRGRLGLFPLEQTTAAPFVRAMIKYTARDTREISLEKGDILPAAPSDDPARYTLYREAEYGLAPRAHFTTLGPPSAEDRR